MCNLNDIDLDWDFPIPSKPTETIDLVERCALQIIITQCVIWLLDSE